ncbi:MAG TPA: class I adenylate-forming enzyme family protein [Polyangia bacterium]|jgi:long-chain acyl-CoA synthetase|nr:class I adenylate-forming enzyme family protein [Polyangia bacterium]
MKLYQWLSNVATDRGSGKALVYRDTYLSWRGLLHRVDRRAQELHAMGIGAGAWVGLMLGNVPDFVILALALSKLDAVVVPLDPTMGNRELEMVLEAAPLRALITRPRGGEPGQPANGASPYYTPPPAARPGPVARVSPPSKFVPENRRRLQGTLLTCSLYKRTPLAGLGDSRPAVVQFTASVGGDPKGVLKTTSNLEAAAHAIGVSLDIKPDDRVLCTMPLHHSYGFDFGLLATLAHGTSLFLEDEISPKRIAKLLREQKVDVFPGTPALFGALARVPTVKPLKISGARYLSSGSMLPLGIAETFHQRFGIRLISCYHSTQAGPLALDRPGKDPTSVGKGFEGVELHVAGSKGERIAAGEVGPVWARSSALSMLVTPKIHLPRRDGGVAIGDADSDGWFRTGDLGQMDRNGRVTITGREDDLVKVDGKRVALGEVEGCLEAFPKVKAAQARVVTDDLGGPMVIARVVRAGVCKAEDIIDHCARNLAPYKVPRQIEFCEALTAAS